MIRVLRVLRGSIMISGPCNPCDRLNSDDPPKPRKEMIHPFDGSQKPPVGATFLATEPKDEVTIGIPTKRHTYVEETHMVITRLVGIRHRLP